MTKYLWIDMEMSGLEVEKCRILEAAAIITDENFQPIESVEAIIYQQPEVLNAMDDWCKKTHGESGLTAAVAKGLPENEAEDRFIQLLDRHFSKDEKVVLCGNSIGQDRKFIDFYWKRFSTRLHYRMVDVSSFKVIFRNKFNIEYKKMGGHRALNDIQESIDELKTYLSYVKI